MTSGTAWLIHDDRLTPLPVGWAPLVGHRAAEEWRWQVIDRDTGQVTGRMDGVEGGNLRLNVYADTRGTGSLRWSGPLDDMPTWRNIRVQPVYVATLLDGSSVEWPMGVYLCTSPRTDVQDGWAEVDVSLFDPTLVLRRAKLSKTSGVNAGTAVVSHVRLILDTQAPSVRHALEDSDATLRSSMVWEPGTPWLRVINDLLDAAGMFALWADADGVLRSSPYVRPQDRPLVWDFAEGATAVHEAGVQHDRDDFDVPNRITLISRADGDLPALRARLTLDDIDPASPYAYAQTGEWVDRVEDNIEAADLAVLQARADRLLREGVSVASTVTLTHAPLPLGLQDRVSVHTGGLVVPSAVIQSVDIPCAAGEDWTTTVREVAA